jgi:hypothetical protein
LAVSTRSLVALSPTVAQAIVAFFTQSLVALSPTVAQA